MSARSRLAATLALLAVLPGAALAQDTSDAVPRCDGKFGLCRYVDRTTQQELIPARFERAMPFSEGLAAVRIRGKFGYIDETGEVVIAPRFDLAGEFHQGLAEILMRERAGVINRAGLIVVPASFARAVPWTKNVVLVSEGAWRSGYYPGAEKLEPLKQGPFHRGLIGLFHVGGYWIRKPAFRSVRPFAPDGAPVWASETSESGPFGLLMADGTWLVEPQYDYGGALLEGHAIVRKRVNGEDLSGIIGRNGEVIVPLQSKQLQFYRHDGWGLVRERGSNREGFIDQNGNLIGGRYFDKVRRPVDERVDVATVLIDGLWKGLDRAGNVVPHPDNGRAMASCPNGVRVIAQDGKIQITDANGWPTLPYLLEPLVSKPDCQRPFPVQRGSKWGFVATDGRPLFDPPNFDNSYAFDGNHAVVSQSGKWGIIDTSGRFVQLAKFDAYKGKRGELFQFVLDGREIWITATGDERPAPAAKYTPVAEALSCGHGMRLIERDGQWGIVEADGRTVIAPRFRALTCFQSGVAWAALDSRREWCPVGPDDTVRAAPQCQVDVYPLMPSHASPERLSDDRYENSVLWTRAYLEFHSGRREVPPGWVGDGVRGGPRDKIIR
jgi:hypothetical protein